MENHPQITPFGALVNQIYSGTFKSLNYISIYLCFGEFGGGGGGGGGGERVLKKKKNYV